MKRILVVFILCLTVVFFLQAQQPDSSLLTLERLFSSRDFAGQFFGPARWLEDGSGYTTLEPSPTLKPAREIVRYNPESGKREVLIAAERLVPEGAKEPLSIENYEWSSDGRLLLIFTNGARVWRTNTRGDYWVLDLRSWKLSKLGGDAPPSTLMFAKISPDGKNVSFVRQNNVYVEDLATHRIQQLTTDGSTTIINGTFDWVYEEEFGLRDGTRWSPDGKQIAFWQLDASGVRDFYLINNTDSLYSRVIPIQYPKAGTTNSACKVGVVSVAGGPITWFNVPGDPRNTYIARMEWAGNSQEIILQHFNRQQNRLDLMLGDAQTGNVRTIFVDEDKAWVEVVDDLKWLDGGKQFTWLSERDGWNHVYLVSRDGKNISLVTKGDYDVVNVERIDAKGGWLYFTASPENPTQRYLYRTLLSGKGKLERISPAAQSGGHNYTISADGKWAFHTYSSFNNPPVIDLVRLPSHQSVRLLSENAEMRAKVNSLKRAQTEFFRVDIGDGVKLDGWMMKPHDFNPAKKYPVLFHVYGEPAGQTVIDRWGGRNYLWHTMFTQKGYIVMSVDNRGTPAPRGREWRKSIYGKIGIINAADQAAANRVIRIWPFVDSTRIAVWGWSGGGSMTLNLMFQYPDLYQTGMSVAPVGDQRFYDSIYQERYMGLPQENPDGFKNGSPVTHAGGLKGNLLLIHGTGDDNVHFQNSEVVINKLVELNKPFTMMAYPNRSHGIFEGRNTTRHLFELLTNYLLEKVPAGMGAQQSQ